MQKQDNFCQKKYQKTLHINAQTNRPVASGGGPARLALRFAALIVIWGRNLHHRLIEVRELKCFFHDLSPLRCKYPVHYATRCAFVCVCTCVRACECVCVCVHAGAGSSDEVFLGIWSLYLWEIDPLHWSLFSPVKPIRSLSGPVFKIVWSEHFHRVSLSFIVLQISGWLLAQS